jgi:hypothetical protein
MEWANGTRWRCLLISSKNPAYRKSVIAMLNANGIQTEEGLHRPWHAAGFESAIMVSPEDFPKASALYNELETLAGTNLMVVSGRGTIGPDGVWQAKIIA